MNFSLLIGSLKKRTLLQEDNKESRTSSSDKCPLSPKISWNRSGCNYEHPQNSVNAVFLRFSSHFLAYLSVSREGHVSDGLCMWWKNLENCAIGNGELGANLHMSYLERCLIRLEKRPLKRKGHWNRSSGRNSTSKWKIKTIWPL